jgi:type IV secretion system protein VirB3
MYAVVWLFGAVLLFVWIQSFLVLGIAAVLYPVLWKAAIGTRGSSTLR